MIDTLFDRIGPAVTLGALVNNLHDRLIADDLVNHHFAGIEPREMKRHQRALLTIALGGEDIVHTADDIRSIHRRMPISNAEFDAVAGHVRNVLSDLGIERRTIAEVDIVMDSARARVVRT